MIMLLQYTRHTRLTLICHQRQFRERSCQIANPLAITKRNDLPTTLCTILDSVNPVLYPSTDTIVCVLLIMPIKSDTRPERSFSVLSRLKTYVRSTIKNDTLSSLGLMHIHRVFEVDLYKATKVLVSAIRHEGQILKKIKKCLSIKVI